MATSLRDSLPNTNTNNSHSPTKLNNDNKHDKSSSSDKPKKINPKMAKKYAGRGLKTITVSGPGLPSRRFKICVGNHPDDIQKWIEERKKRFPRSDNGPLAVEDSNNSVEKQKEKKKKRDRDQDTDDQEVSTTQKKKVCINEKAKDDNASNNNEESTADAGGLSSLLAGYDSTSSQEEGEVTTSKPKTDLKNGGNNNDKTSEVGNNNIKSPPEEAKVNNEEATTNITVQSQQTHPTTTKRICKYYQRGKCRHGTNCNFLHTAQQPSTEQKHKARQSQSERDKARNAQERELQILGLSTPSHKNRYDKSGAKVINNTSLLHKLLQRDKERERRMTLQLLRYIVDCDYYQKKKNDGDDDKGEEKVSAAAADDDNQLESGKGDEDEDGVTKQPSII